MASARLLALIAALALLSVASGEHTARQGFLRRLLQRSAAGEAAKASRTEAVSRADPAVSPSAAAVSASNKTRPLVPPELEGDEELKELVRRYLKHVGKLPAAGNKTDRHLMMYPEQMYNMKCFRALRVAGPESRLARRLCGGGYGGYSYHSHHPHRPVAAHIHYPHKHSPHRHRPHSRT